MALLQKRWIMSCEQCRETVVCRSCFVFEFLGAGVVTTCGTWNKVGSSTANWFPSRESSAVVKFARCSLWDSSISGKAQRNKCLLMEMLLVHLFTWNAFWCNMMSLQFALLNFISVVFVELPTCASSCFYLCMFVLYIFLLENTLNGHFNSYLIVYILNIMFCFLFNNKYCFKPKFLGFFFIDLSHWLCACVEPYLDINSLRVK